ncbi:MAG: hypothetical protein M0022_03425 [Desulfobacteraceae bacterium]|nr:hypothetical protein [Desulfobacteraceae bacterium]
MEGKTDLTARNNPKWQFCQGSDRAKYSTQPKLTIKDLYPHFNEDELKEAEKNMDAYLKLMIRIFEDTYGKDYFR